MEAKTTGALFGESTAGKSFVAVDLAACMATGTPWIGHSIATPGIALYFAGEGRHGLPRRFKAWQEEREVIIPKNKLFLPDGRVEIAPSGVRTITMAIDELPDTPELITIDTVARSLPSGSDENSAKDMMEFINAVDVIRDRYGCVIALIHHTGHSETAQTRARGSSAFRAAMDWEILIDKNKSAIRWKKMKDSELPEALSFELVSVGESAVMTYGEAVKSSGANLTKTEELGLSTLKECCARLEKPWATVEEWRFDFYRRHTGDTTAAKRQAFRRCREKLVSKSIILLDNDVYRPSVTSATQRDNVTNVTGLERDRRYTPLKGVACVTHPEHPQVECKIEVIR